MHEFDVDPTLEQFPLPQCVTGGSDGGVCFTTTVGERMPLPDADGDGLADLWETEGYDGDCNGVLEWGPDVLLPQLGVSSSTKDLLIEVNWYDGSMPSAAQLQAVREMFANAPDDAGGVIATGGGGIRVIFDADNEVDATGTRIGDELGHYYGGTNLGNPNDGPASDEDIRQLAQQLVDAPQVGLFRTIVFGPEYLVAGGHAMGDFIYLDSANPIAIAHELGHSLGLHHGGDEHWNCKPNHYSIMNYIYAGLGLPYRDRFGSQRRFMDFSPAQIDDPTLTDNARMPLLPELIETNTDEDEWMAETLPNYYPRQEITYTNKNGFPTTTEVGGANLIYVDWNNNKLRDSDGVNGVNVDQGSLDDVNVDGFFPAPIVSYGGIEACYTAPLNMDLTSTPMRHVDEWSIVRLAPFASVGDPLYLDLITHDPLPTPAEAQALRTVSSLADLDVTGFVATTPLHVNVPFLVSLTVGSDGPSLAHDSVLQVTLPQGITLVGISADCAEPSQGLLVCPLGALGANTEEEILLELVAGASATLGSRAVGAQLSHDGGDLDPSDNAVSIPIELIPGFASFEDPTRPWTKSWTSPPVLGTVAATGSDGGQSLSLPCGWTSWDSPTFDTVEWEVVGSELWLDVFVPLAQSNPDWVGELQLYFELPAASLYNVPFGTVSLTPLPRGSWTTVTLPVPASVWTTLLGDHPDARLRLASNVASCSSPLLVDNLRFGGELTSRSVYHGAEIPVNVVGPLAFDHLGDWSSPQVLPWSDPVLRSEGTASLAIAPAPWTELTSRPLTAGEAAAATSWLHLDVHVPELPPDPHWVGAVQLYVTCPSVGVQNQFVGQQELYPSFDDEFNSLLFELPSGLVTTLQAGATDCTLKLAVSMNPAWGELRFDRGGFVAP